MARWVAPTKSVGVRHFAQQHAKNVGILAMETYVPSRFVSMTALEKADGIAAGKYTIGLGQSRMAFVDDREDINSICLTAVQRLMDNYGIDPKDVGRLEVGTESLVDKSKSTKTTLMKLFEASGNRSIEGTTNINACYGGTAAMLNSAAWVESSEWDGRYAIFVAADIAVYEAGPARPTGGVGAVAVLIGPDAPLRVVPKLRSTHSVDAYDFYKPTMSSEYPTVDGKFSQVCYLKAVDDCYLGTMSKLTRQSKRHTFLSLDTAFDYMCFHSPYNKLVQQSFRRMLFLDAHRLRQGGHPLPSALEALESFAGLPLSDTYQNRDLDKALQSCGNDAYRRMVGPSEEFSKNIGNSYTAAVWANLLCLADAKGKDLEGKRIGVFSYGSGAIATLLTLEGATEPPGSPFTLQRIHSVVGLHKRLAARTEATPAEFVDALRMRESTYGTSSFTPHGSLDNVGKGVWYLKEVTAQGTRVYDRK